MHPQQAIPNTTPPASAKKIWLSALLPLGGVLLFLIFMAIGSQRDGWNPSENFFTTCMVLQALLTLGCWISFSIALRERIRGNNAVILIIFYPIIQIGLQFVIFFCGCLALLTTGLVK